MSTDDIQFILFTANMPDNIRHLGLQIPMISNVFFIHLYAYFSQESRLPEPLSPIILENLIMFTK